MSTERGIRSRVSSLQLGTRDPDSRLAVLGSRAPSFSSPSLAQRRPKRTPFRRPFLVVAEREGFESYRLCTPFAFLQSFAPQKYAQGLRIPPATRAGASLLPYSLTAFARCGVSRVRTFWFIAPQGFWDTFYDITSTRLEQTKKC